MTKALRLRDRLFLLVLVCVLPLALVALVQQYTWYTEKRNAEYDRLLSISRSLAVSIEHDQQTRTTALRTLANARSLRSGDFDTFRASADDFLQHQPLGASLGVVDDLGRDVVSVTRNPNAAGIQREQPYLAPSATVQRVFESGSAVVSGFHPGSVDGRPGYRIDVPVIVDGRVAYVLFLELPSSSLTDLLSRQHLPDHAVAAFLDPQGLLVARVPDADQFVGQRAVPALVARLQSGKGGLMEIPTLDGTPTFAAVSLVPSTGWAIAVGVPRRVVLQPVWRDVAMSLGISGLVLVVALGLAALVARRITEPMATLRRSALAPPQGGAVATGLPEADEVSAALTAAEQSRRTAAADLAEVEHRLELARDGANLGVWDWNARTGVLTWDRREWILHGLEPRESGPTYAMWRSIMHPEDCERVRAVGLAAMQDPEGRFEVEYRVRAADGGWRWLMGRARVERAEDGTPARMVGINIDITHRKEAEEALREAASLLRLTHQIAGTGSFEWEVGAAEASISEQYAAICGLPEGTTSESWRHASARVHPEDRAGLAALLEQTVRGDCDGYAHTFRIIRTNDRAIRFLLCRAEAIREKGHVTLIGILRDVTEERQAQDELQRLNRGLEVRVREEIEAREAAQRRAAQAERMQALGQIAGGIAHDFNNVLQAVSGGAALIERRSDNPESVRRHIRMISEAARRGASITSRLLSFARRGDLRAEQIEAASLLADLSEVFSHTLGRLVTMRTEVAAGLPPLFADRGQLETVLVNLATNARDAMPQGGTLTMTAWQEVLGAGSTHPAGLAAGSYVAIGIADTGEGMSPDVLARATDPFYTTKEPGKGTGLGLPMAKGFAEQSGGGLAIDSEPGRGTTVTLWLPVAKGLAGARDTQVEPARPDPAAGRARVLLVDDDPIVLEVMVDALEDAGYAVVPADGGDAALAELSGSLRPDILVTDLTMPGMDGLTLIRAAQAKLPALPAILVTGYAGDSAALAVGGAISGSFSLLRKPVTGSQLADRIASLLESRETRRARS